MSKKSIIIKVFLIILLVGIIVVAGIFIGKTSNNYAQANTNSKSNTIKKTYALTNEELKPNIILKDNVFDTQIQDLNINFNKYEGKTVEIEGLYFKNGNYQFVGRYSTSSLCPTCPSGYSYLEFEWHGEEPIEIKEEDDWIRVIGILKKGNDGVDYYYLDAQRIDIMSERGQDTVTN